MSVFITTKLKATFALSALSLSSLAFADYGSNTLEEKKALGGLDHQKALGTVAAEQEVVQAGQAAQQATTEATQTAVARSVAIDETWTTDEIYAKLEENPAAFEKLLLRSLAQSDAVALKVLLPAYDRYPYKDQSVIDWGSAILKLDEGKTAEAVAEFRKVNAALPDVRLLRLQMASALYRNKQTRAAKDELQKLLRADISEKERNEITSYIDAINRQAKWNYNVNLSFVKDNNLDDNPKVGTTNEYGWQWTTPREEGTGAKYYVGADKRWLFDNKLFTSFSTGVGGTYYWDNKKYNDVYTHASVGLGYQTATGEIELAPSIGKSWYGGGSSSSENESLKSYTDSVGVRLSGHKWITPKFLYQHSTQFTDLKYKEPYSSNDGELYSMYNGIVYAPNAKGYYSAAWNLSKKDGARVNQSYERTGVTLGWQNTWSKGIVTNATLGIASKKYDSVNFWSIKRHNREYDLGLSIWKRDFSVFGLTPKLHLNATKVTSNDTFEEKSSADATVSLSKTF